MSRPRTSPVTPVQPGSRPVDGAPIRVLLAAAEERLRTRVRAVLEAVPGMRVVAEPQTDATALAQARKGRPHVVLLDGSGLLHALATTRRLLAEPTLSGLQVMVIGSAQREQDVLAAWRSGAAGILPRDFAPRDLVRAVRVAATGSAFVVPSPSRRFMRPHR